MKTKFKPLSWEEKKKIAHEFKKFFHEIRNEFILGEKFTKEEGVKFLFGIIFDQGIPADRAWKAPSELKERIGHLDPKKISAMNPEELTKAISMKPALHRYVNKMSDWILEASKRLIKLYNGDARNVWNDKLQANELVRRFEGFKGIKQKKASMATNILVRDYRIEIKDKEGIDVSNDRHVRRVFLRSGLIEYDDQDEVIRIARELNPKYPGIFDLPAWMIGGLRRSGGKGWCKRNGKKAQCDKCWIRRVCARRVELQEELV